MISLPFTISAVILIVACSISKIQYSSTYLAIAIHAFLGPLESASLIVSFVQYLTNTQTKFTIKILFIIALTQIAVFNLLAFAIQTPFMAQDRMFLKWLKRRDFKKSPKFNLYWFYFISIFTLLTNYKFKMLLFSRLFSFDCLKCQLQSLQKFKLFNIFAFLGLIPQIIILYCAWVQVFSTDSSSKIFSMLIDLIIIVVLNIIFSILSVIKQQDFFKEQIDGVPINKVINLAEQSFQTTVKIGRGGSNPYSLQDIVQVNEMAYESTKRDVANIHLQYRKSDVNDQKVDGDYSEEITVTERQNSSKNGQNHSIRQQNFTRTKLNLNPRQQQSQYSNILMVDEYFSFGSQNYEDPHERGDEWPESMRKNDENPTIEINRIEQILDQPEKISDKDNINTQESGEVKSKKINLAQYLIKAQKKHQFVRRRNQAPKFDKVEEEPTKQQNMQEAQIDHFATQIIQQQYGQFQIQVEGSSGFIDNESSINFKSQPTGFKAKKLATLTNRLEPTSFQNAIQKIVANHNSPKKDMISEQRKQRRSREIQSSKTSFKLNQDHQQKVVSNRSKEKVKSIHNHPINSPENKHSHQSPKNILMEDEEVIQSKQNIAKRQHLKIKKLNDQFSQNKADKLQDSENGRTGNTLKQDSFFKQFLKNQDETDKKQETFKEFKRSIPQSLTFFPHKKNKEVQLIQNNQSNHPPRKPTSSIMQRLKQRFSAKCRQKTDFHRQNGIFFRSSKNVKRNKSSESRRNQLDEARQKQSDEYYMSQSYFSEDKRKKYSLQKIYLQKLTR